MAHYSISAGDGGSGVGGVSGVGGSGGSVNVQITNHTHAPGSSSSAILVGSLPRAYYAGYNSGRKDLPSPCLEGTQVDTLKNIMSWLKRTAKDTPPVYWLDGLAGIGKSTIAWTIAGKAQKEGMLGASFFFSRSDRSLCDPHTVFRTLAFQLANADDAFKAVIVEALERNPGVPYESLSAQLEGLILAPLRKVNRNRRTLIILDALDECEESGAGEILQYLLKHATQIPFLCILISSRPEPHISSVFDEDPNHITMVLHDVEPSIVQRDIRLYVRTEFKKITRKFRRHVAADWATEAEVNMLVERSGNLFIYVATCIRFVGDDRVLDPQGRLHIILGTTTAQQTSATPYRQLDGLYMGILRNSLSDSDPEVIVERFQAVVGTIAVLRDPLPLESLARFVKYRTEVTDAALCHLRSLIITPLNIHEAPRVYHHSFLDFITDPRRCSLPEFVIVPIPDQERRCAIRCFEVMETYLKRNMAEILDLSLLNSEVHGLEEKVKNALPPEAQYACKFWGSHLSRVPFGGQTLVDALERFSVRSILWWLEAMSLIGSSFTAAGCIQEAQRWAIGSKCQTTLATMLSDSYRFFLAHAQVIRESALHVYFSALAFTPHDTAIYKAYGHEDDHSISVLQGVESQWPQTLAILPVPWFTCPSVAFSPDGL